MADNARGIHVSPGVYSREIELNYAVKSLGITTLGLVGETQRGPAFQPMSIENWRQFQDVFGGTSAEKFVASQYPKYELPYIAKSYLSESNQLEVCRVLGLSGFNAGPAWLITAPTNNVDTGDGHVVVAVIRSRANYEKYVSHTIKSSGDCACGTNEYDRLTFDVGDIDFAGKDGYCKYPKHSYGDALQMKPYIPFESSNPCEGLVINPGEPSEDNGNILVQSNDYGHFKLVGVLGQIKVKDIEKSEKAARFANTLREGKEEFEDNYPEYEGRYFEYSLSLNPADKDYILKVLGTNPQDGTAPIYVESLYDVAYQELVDSNKIGSINGKLYFYDNYNIKDFCQLKPVNGFVTKKEEELSRKEVGKRYLCTKSDFTTCHSYNYDLGTFNTEYDESISGVSSAYTVCGEIYTVKQYTDKKHIRHYYYAKMNPDTINGFTGITSGISKNIAKDVLIPQNKGEDLYTQSVTRQATMVKNLNDNFYYRLKNTSDNTIKYYINLPNYSGTTYNDRGAAEAQLSAIAPSKTTAITVTYKGTMYSFSSQTEYDNALVRTVTSTDNNTLKKTTVQLNVTFTKEGLGTVDVSEKTKYVNYKENAQGNYVADTETINKVKEELEKLGDEVKSQITSDGSYYKFDNGTASGLHFSTLQSAKNSLIVATGGEITRVFCDMNNYKSGYRFASTPWIVSNLKGDYESAEVNKLFRFHTISDGNSSNNEIKISIVNIRPDDGTFDVLVRRIDDTDASIIKLESFSKCNLIPGSDHYIGYLIGTYNGDYEVKSKYITVEINETLTTKASAPAGFIGYPLPKYDSAQIYEIGSGSTNDKLYVNENAASVLAQTIVPRIAYNTLFNEDIKHRRQYFGLSDITGVDIDLFTFKGNASYPVESIDEPYYLTPGFHLDSRIGTMQKEGMNISVEGITGYTFDTVSTESATDIYDGIPLIGKEEEMYASIFEYVDLRKFTVYFYGGFDGWDEFRDARTNTDDFKMTKYKGEYSQLSGEGYAFDKLRNPELYAINEADAITSDYYAYLSAMRQFANPEAVDINVFATPGIDLINNRLLCEEAIDMVEEERADSIYIATIPDKPYGASDYNDEMYSPDDIVYELEETEIDSNYTCTYYPWVKYYDEDNYQYINLPVTKDVVRNMALTDNTTHPWFAPAGISRGDVSCEHAHYITSLADEDILYEGRINPVKTFANDGVKLWGQKNLQIRESQLNRINVRRLLLRMRKLVAIACRNLIFEPNDNTTKASFLSTVTPILDNIKSNRGISDYKIEVNDTVESRERRELPAKIYFKPINALEYITLDFIVTPEGVSFDNI